MRICIISPLPLFPNSSGATARITSIIKYFAEKGHEVFVVLPYFYEGTEVQYQKLGFQLKINFFKMLSVSIPLPSEKTTNSLWAFLRKIRALLPFNVVTFSPSNIVQLYFAAKGWRPDVIISEFDGSWLVGYVLGKLLDVPLIIDKHNVETVQYYRTLKRGNSQIGLIDRLKTRVVWFLELLVWRKSSGAVAVSEHDLSVAKKMFGPKKNLAVVSNGISSKEIGKYQHSKQIREWLRVPFDCKIMVFHGLGTYWPNVDARQRIIEKILPLTKKLSKNMDVYAVIVGPGNAPSNTIQCSDHVRIVGEVSKSKLYEILAISDVAVVPLRSGSGTRLKILDYFGLLVPVVATTLAVEGLPVKDRVELLIRNDDKEIAKAVSELFLDTALCQRLTESAFSLVTKKFDWESVLQPLEELTCQLALANAKL